MRFLANARKVKKKGAFFGFYKAETAVFLVTNFIIL